MSRKSDQVKAWRERTKQRIIKSMGGCCGVCNYNACSAALELHHLDPTKKEISLGSVRASPINWDSIVRELRKCVMLCANCHREVHSKILIIPKDIKRFNESYADYKKTQRLERLDYCPICSKQKPKFKKTCSPKCRAEKACKVSWKSVNLNKLVKQFNNCEIAAMLNISETAVRKRRKKLNLV